MTTISFTTSPWILVYFYTVGFISFVFSLVTVLLIIFKNYADKRFTIHVLLYQVDSGKNLYISAIFQLSSTNAILQYTVFLQPISLFPIIGGYCEGFLATYFQIWCHYLIVSKHNQPLIILKSFRVSCWYPKSSKSGV